MLGCFAHHTVDRCCVNSMMAAATELDLKFEIPPVVLALLTPKLLSRDGRPQTGERQRGSVRPVDGRIHTVVISPVLKNPSGGRTATLRMPNRVWLLTLKLALETVPSTRSSHHEGARGERAGVREVKVVANCRGITLTPSAPSSFIRRQGHQE